MSVQQKKLRRRNHKKELIEFLGSKCTICGYNKCDYSLHFHHIDKSQKKFTISKKIDRKILDLKEEAEKCVLLCANCHGEVEYNITESKSLNELQTIYQNS
jgi:hypothetical protein